MKKIFHDIIPKEKRSIRNIPLTKREDRDDVGDTSAIEVPFGSTVSPVTESNSRHHSKVSHSMDGIRPKQHSYAISTKSAVDSLENDKEYKVSKFAETETNTPDDDEDDYIDQPVFKKQSKKGMPEIEPAFFEASAKDFNNPRTSSESPSTEESSDSSFEEWNRHQKKSYTRAAVVLVLFICAVFFLLSTYFGGATISINPIRHDVVLQETKIALNTISYETVTTKLESSDDVIAKGVAKVERKASGKVVLYNAYNSATQKLVAETRLETPNGLVYKLKSAVSIPGQKTVNGKLVPGSVEAEVEASEPGEKYNQGFKDFNVVAYKGSDRYEGIYGRSKTALSNGFSGTVPNVAAKEIASSTLLIKEKISNSADEFFSKKAKEKGANYVYIPSTKKIVFGEVQNEISKDGKTATLKIEATATAVLFDSTTLFAEIIKNQSEQITEQIENETGFDSTKEIVYTGDFSRLTIKMGDETSLQVTGTTSISSAIDTTKVTRAVSGLSKEQAIGAIKRLVELETIEIDIRPWWNKKLPSAEKINIQTEK